jgi:hypothetical protein
MVPFGGPTRATRRSRLLALAFAALGTLGTSTVVGLARADSPSSTPATSDALPKDEARQRFERGLSLFRAGAYEAALAEFFRSRELFRTRAAAENAALSLQKLGRFDEALDLLDEVDRDYPDLPPAERAQLRAQRAELVELVSTLDITVDQGGASVLVDNRDYGKTPLGSSIRVSAGSHLVRIYKEGFAPFERRIDVAGRRTLAVTARLNRMEQVASLAVREDHGLPVTVVVDGVAVGITPWQGNVAPGTHTVFLRGEGRIGSLPANAVVELNQLATLSLGAEELACTLRVEPTPLNADVAVDGVGLGRGVWRGRERCGKHTLEVASPGFLPRSMDVVLVGDQPGGFNVSLERDPSSPLWRAANPPRITVGLDAALPFGSMGGDLVSACKSGCTAGPSFGALMQARFGYRASSGLTAGAEIGFLTLSETITGRAATVTPVGAASTPSLLVQNGKARDELRLSGPALGVQLGFERGRELVWMAHLGAGIAFENWQDSRQGTFTTAPAPQGVSYSTPSLTETGSTPVFYMAPEFRLGYRLGRVVLDVGVRLLVLFLIDDATWTDTSPVQAGLCPSTNHTVCAGLGQYGQTAAFGKTMLFVAPLVGAQYEF